MSNDNFLFLLSPAVFYCVISVFRILVISPAPYFLLYHPRAFFSFCRALFSFVIPQGTLSFLSVIPGLRPGDPNQQYGFFIYLDCRIKSGNDQEKKQK